MSLARSVRCTAPLFVCIAAIGCGDVVAPTNPFDPEATVQATGTVTGSVQAVYARDDAGEPAVPGACAARDGDHSGFNVTLRGARSDGRGITANGVSVGSGEFVFNGVPPGPYTLEISQTGYDVPPPLDVTVGIGEDIVLTPVCALYATGPARPVIATLPQAVQATAAAPIISVIDVDTDCESNAPGCPVAYTIVQSVDGVGEVARATVGIETAQTALVLGAGPGTRRTVQVEVFAVDALDNASAPAVANVVVDGIAPDAPVDVSAAAGRDRVSLRWSPVAPVGEDDAPTSYVVSYGLVARTTADGCDHGRPTFDDDGFLIDRTGRANFALEGASPLLTTSTTQLLSGVAPGTEVVVHVAAVDAAGNAGCYGPPVVSRPDDVTFAGGLVRTGVVASGVVAARTIGSPRTGTLVAARGSGGLAIVDDAGTVAADATPANDVAVDGDTIYTAAGLLGVRAIRVDGAGVPIANSERFIQTSTDVRAVAVRAGQVVFGSTTDLGTIDVDNADAVTVRDAGAAVVALRPWGRRVIAIRSVQGQARAEVWDTAVVDGRVAQSALEATTPSDSLIVGGQLWLALGDQGVVALDLEGCRAGGTCLDVVGRRSLPGGARALRLAVADDRVIVAGDDDGDTILFALDSDAALSVRGRLVVAAGTPNGLFVDDGGACVLVAASNGDTVHCTDVVSAFFVDEERRFASGLSVLRVRAGHGFAFAIERGDTIRGPSVAVLDIATLGLVKRVALSPAGGIPHDVQPISLTVLDDGRVVVLDNLGRLLVVEPDTDDSETSVAFDGALDDVVADLGDITDPGHSGFEGFIEARGSTMILAVSSSTGAGLVRIQLSDALGDAVGLPPVAADAVAVDGIRQFTKLILDGDRALVPTQPFGLFSVAIDGALAIDATASLTVDSEATSFAADVARTTVGGALATVVVGARGVSGGGIGAGLFVTDGGTITATLAAPDDVIAAARSMTVLRNRIVLGTLTSGVVVLDDVIGDGVGYVPVLTLPSASQVAEPVATPRGVLVADGSGGVVFAVLR